MLHSKHVNKIFKQDPILGELQELHTLNFYFYFIFLSETIKLSLILIRVL